MRIETRALYMFLGLALGALVVIFTSGCSTIKGLATDMYSAAEAIGSSARDTD